MRKFKFTGKSETVPGANKHKSVEVRGVEFEKGKVVAVRSESLANKIAALDYFEEVTEAPRPAAQTAPVTSA